MPLFFFICQEPSVRDRWNATVEVAWFLSMFKNFPKQMGIGFELPFKEWWKIFDILQ